MKNHETISKEVAEKLKERKIKGEKNINFLSFPSSKIVDSLLYVDDSMLKVRTVMNIDGSLEIFIEKSLKQ